MRVVLGVTGCIAAYKSAIVLRLLQEQGADIFPVMTRSARHFLGELTLEKLSGHKVVTELFSDQGTDIEHIRLARSSDLLLVAPATANVIAKFANGIADDFLSTLYVSTTTPVVVAPAMNVEMWRHAATRENLRRLSERGDGIVEPESGFLACGEVGEGRLAEPQQIVSAVIDRLQVSRQLAGSRVLVSAGPTVEDIDPVRFLSNRSTGRMGFSIAEEARRRGARVTLVSGPTHLQPPSGCELVEVRSAREMEHAVVDRFENADITVMAAAVSDFTPLLRSDHKVKKAQAPDTLQLQRTTDILELLGTRKTDGQLLVGFAAETKELEPGGQAKLQRKNLDLIFVNDVSRQEGGFASRSNQVLCLDRLGARVQSDLLPKNEIARFVWDRVTEFQASRAVAETPLHS